MSELRWAMSEHDTDTPLTAAELLTLAAQIETHLIAFEVQFSDPEWRYVDGLRALAHALPS
jgi:hypothetical protein